jgi:predicted site-specific integrase-resolvase
VGSEWRFRSEDLDAFADFMSLVATFAGRMYGIRSREARARLLDRAADRLGGTR